VEVLRVEVFMSMGSAAEGIELIMLDRHTDAMVAVLLTVGSGCKSPWICGMMPPGFIALVGTCCEQAIGTSLSVFCSS
jgi:hypothetical protein